jgi:hypothetical protein
MSRLHANVDDYLRLRRAHGFKLKDEERLLGQFVDHVEAAGATTLTTDVASMFNVIVSGRAPASHTRARAFARAARICPSSRSSTDLITRCVVVSDARG